MVTGGASGIGAAICAQLSADGHRVAVLDVDADGAAGIASDLAGGSVGIGVDVAAVCAFLCSEAAGYVTGQVISPNGGAST